MAIGAAAGTVVFALQSRSLAATFCVPILIAAILGFRAAQAKLHCARQIVAAPNSVVAAQVGEMHQSISIRGISYRATLLRLVLATGTPYEVAMSPEGIGAVVSWLRASSPSFGALPTASITHPSAPEA